MTRVFLMPVGGFIGGIAKNTRYQGHPPKVIQENCSSSGGSVWLGEGRDCESCASSIGACCVDSGCTQLDETSCDELGGTWTGGGSCDDCQPYCMSDVNGDAIVDVLDLLEVIAAWGNCP